MQHTNTCWFNLSFLTYIANLILKHQQQLKAKRTVITLMTTRGKICHLSHKNNNKINYSLVRKEIRTKCFDTTGMLERTTWFGLRPQNLLKRKQYLQLPIIVVCVCVCVVCVCVCVLLQTHINVFVMFWWCIIKKKR